MHRTSSQTAARGRISLNSAAVALILAMHGLGVYLLLLPPRQLKQYTEVAFMTLMPPRPLARTPPMPLPMPMPAPPPVARQRPPAVAAETPPAAPAGSISLAPGAPASLAVEEAAPAAPVDDLRTRARLAAGAADQALRAELKQDKPWLAAPALRSDSKFSALVASAWRGGPVIALEDYVNSDGRAGTRVVTAAGATCYGIQANPLGGADPANTAGKVKRVPCP